VNEIAAASSRLLETLETSAPARPRSLVISSRS
jgi:hypothetical protein